MRHHFLKLLLLISCLLGLALPSARAANYLTFAIVPQQAASELAETWSPVLTWLSRRSGVQLRFATAPDIPQFEQRVASGKYDFAYMNPYHFVVFNKAPGYNALARAKDNRIKGILVVRKDSPIKELNDLNGKTLVFPAPAAFAASILPRAELHRQGIDFTTKFVSSHDSVYLNVAKGLFPAGGGITRTLNLTDEETRNNLRVLWTTPAFTSHAIASHPKVTQDVRNRVWQAMEAMSKDPEGLALLEKIGFKGFEPAANSDWDDIRHLNIRVSDTQG